MAKGASKSAGPMPSTLPVAIAIPHLAAGLDALSLRALEGTAMDAAQWLRDSREWHERAARVLGDIPMPLRSNYFHVGYWMGCVLGESRRACKCLAVRHAIGGNAHLPRPGRCYWAESGLMHEAATSVPCFTLSAFQPAAGRLICDSCSTLALMIDLEGELRELDQGLQIEEWDDDVNKVFEMTWRYDNDIYGDPGGEFAPTARLRDLARCESLASMAKLLHDEHLGRRRRTMRLKRKRPRPLG